MNNTQEKIKQYFYEYVSKNGIEKLKITTMCKDLNISRKTFYQYFSDKYAILDYIFTDLIINSLKKNAEYNIDNYLTVRIMYEEFYRNKSFFIKAYDYRGQNSLKSLVIEHIEKINLNFLLNDDTLFLTSTDKKFIAYYYAVSQATILDKWINGGMIIPPEVIARYCKIMLWDSLNYTVKNLNQCDK